MTKEFLYDVIIIGGGASGLMIADNLNDKNLKVLLIERNRRLGIKLLLTGNGRCNVLSSDNGEDFVKAVHNGRFLRTAFHKYDLKNFFKTHNLPLKQENCRLYPASEKARDVVACFKTDNIEILKGEKVEDFIFENEKLVGVKTENSEFFAKNVVVCSGGKSYPQSGSDGLIHKVLKKYDVKQTKIYPSEVALIYPHFSELSGIALENVRMYNKKRERTGDLLFTHKGLSGPLAISMGEFVARGENMFVDFYPTLDEEQLAKKLFEDNKYLQTKFPKNFYKFIMTNFPEKTPSKKEIRKFTVNFIKRYELKDVKTMPLEYAFVTAGGVDLKNVSPKTCAHKKIDNLYFAGEVLDLHGEIGGYNLMIAWLTGLTVANALVEKLK